MAVEAVECRSGGALNALDQLWQEGGSILHAGAVGTDVDLDEDGPGCGGGRHGLGVFLKSIDLLLVVDHEDDAQGFGDLGEAGERAGVEGDAVEALFCQAFFLFFVDLLLQQEAYLVQNPLFG